MNAWLTFLRKWKEARGSNIRKQTDVGMEKSYMITATTPGQCAQNLKSCGHIVEQKMVWNGVKMAKMVENK